jgi:hypothetical protein
MKKQVIKTAGLVWKELDTKGEVNIAQLSRRLKVKTVVVYQSVGWLSREDKIKYRVDGDKVFVSLSHKK